MAHLLVSGMTGSGKSTLVQQLIKLCARAVVLDRLHEYNVRGAHVAYSFDEAVAVLLRVRWGAFILIYRPVLEGDYIRLLQFVAHMQDTEPHGPLACFLEEASNYSETGSIDAFMRQMYNAGRHLRISMVTVVQTDTDIHRVTRNASTIWATMKQEFLTGPMRTKFHPDEVTQLVSLRDEYRELPIQDYNFLVYPRGTRLYAEWHRQHCYILKERKAT